MSLVCPFKVCGDGTLCRDDGVPVSNVVFNIDKIKCRAWVEPVCGCLKADTCEDLDTTYCSLKSCNKALVQTMKEGYCRLLSGKQ